MPEARRDEIPVSEIVKDGEYDATLYKINVTTPDVDYEIKHELGYPPVKVQVVDSSEQIKYPKIVSKDSQRVVLNFAETALITLRFE